MSPDAKLRMDVYQEGQRAFNAGTPCPYTDWRAGTWAKGRAAAEAYHSRPIVEAPETVPCRLCDHRTCMLGTKLCDCCWELESRIRSNPDLARRIIDQL